MVAVPSFKSAFGEFDFTKIMGDFKFPMIDVETVMETHRRNFQALTAANQSVFEAFKGIAQRQADMAKAAVEDFSKVGSELIAAGSIEEKTARNAELMKKGYETAIANARELADLYAKGNAEAFEAINKRIGEALDEFKGAALKK